MIEFNDLKELIETGYDIEFSFNDKEYSITVGIGENGERIISFCEFYKEPNNYNSFDDFKQNARINGIYLKNIWDCVYDVIY